MQMGGENRFFYIFSYYSKFFTIVSSFFLTIVFSIRNIIHKKGLTDWETTFSVHRPKPSQIEGSLGCSSPAEPFVCPWLSVHSAVHSCLVQIIGRHLLDLEFQISK